MAWAVGSPEGTACMPASDRRTRLDYDDDDDDDDDYMGGAFARAA